MPLFDEYKETLKSDIADMLNSPGRPAGAVTAAMFLRSSPATGAWAHLDIAGTAWADEAKSWTAQGRHRRDDPHAGRARARGHSALECYTETVLLQQALAQVPDAITPTVTIVEIVDAPTPG